MKKETKKEKSVTFNQIFKAKKEYEKAIALKNKTYKEYMDILNKSEHLDKKIAKVGNNSWYVTIEIDHINRLAKREPIIHFQPIKKK